MGTCYVDERNLDQAQPGRKVLLYTMVARTSPITGRLVSFRRLLIYPENRRNTGSAYRPRLSPAIVVTDADDALRQGMPVTVQSVTRQDMNDAVITLNGLEKRFRAWTSPPSRRSIVPFTPVIDGAGGAGWCR